MPSNIILECSQFESQSASNSEWTSTFKEAVVLEDQDVFQLQQAMINTQTVSSGSILIENDTLVTIQVAFYECALGMYRIGETVGKHNTIGDYNIPLPYGQVPVGTKPSNPVVGISDAQLHYNSLFNMPVDTALASIYAQDINKYHRPAGYYMLRERAHNDAGAIIDNAPVVTQDVTFTINQGSYTPTKLAAMITDKVTESIDASIGGPPDSVGMLIRKVGTGHINQEKLVRIGTTPDATLQGNNQVSVPYYSIKSDVNVTADRLLGASTFSFEFNDGIFAFTNMHTPIMGEGSGSSTGNVYTIPSLLFLFANSSLGAPKGDIVQAYTGCVITDLQPRPFWNKLGFSDQHIDTNIKYDDAVFQTLESTAQFQYFNNRRVRPRIINDDLLTPTQVGPYWTQKVWDAQTFEDHNNVTQSIPFGDNNYQLQQVDTNYTLAGNQSYVVNDLGYYRVEAETVVSNEYKQEGGRLGNVVGCVSTNYNSNDFITGYGADSGVPYIHAGAAQVISAVKIRIIDPKTGVAAQGLGPNSTIFLEVDKSQQQSAPKGGKEREKKK